MARLAALWRRANLVILVTLKTGDLLVGLPSLWSLLFPPHALAHLGSLPSPDLVLGLTALFLFLLARAAPTYLPTAFSVALRPIFPFQQAQYVQVFLLKPTPFCMLFAGLDSTNKSATSLLLSDSHFVLSCIFSFTSSSLADLAETVFSFLLFYQATVGHRTLVSPWEPLMS